MSSENKEIVTFTDMMVTSEYVGDYELLKALDKLRNNISENKYNEDIKGEIYNDITTFLEGKRTIDPKLKSYLFLGWYISNQYEQCQSESHSTNSQTK